MYVLSAALAKWAAKKRQLALIHWTSLKLVWGVLIDYYQCDFVFDWNVNIFMWFLRILSFVSLVWCVWSVSQKCILIRELPCITSHSSSCKKCISCQFPVKTGKLPHVMLEFTTSCCKNRISSQLWVHVINTIVLQPPLVTLTPPPSLSVVNQA